MRTLMTCLVLVAFVVLSPLGRAQQEMTKDEWQAQMTDLQRQITDLTAQVTALDGDITNLTAQSTKLDGDIRACEDALYALLGVTREEFMAFEKELADMEKRVDELQRMSDEELMTHRDEIERMDARLKELANHKVTKIPRYADRVHALQDKVAGLLKSVAKEKTYTVGTWSRNRDCLWNIAKKKDIYDNAWLWPKIWQGNREMIRDPDVIKPAWVLKIPENAPLTKEEKSAANRYYRKKVAAEPAGQ